MGLYKATIELNALTALPEDTVNNSFYFRIEAGDDTATDTADLHTRLKAFYNDVPATGTKSLSDLIGSQITRATNGCKILYYHTAAFSPPIVSWGTPVASLNWTLGAPDAGTNLPSEVACVSSFHADLTDVPESELDPGPPARTIRPASWRRGRIYIGPLRSNAAETTGSGEARPTSTMRDTQRLAMIDLEADNNDLVWVCASRTAGDSWPVVGGYVDNAFDTQRRRGQEATAREVWAA